MIIDISDFALEQINRTADYIWQVFGTKSQEKFLDDFYHTMNLLAINPLMGPIEPSLANLPIEFHSIVVARKNKAIYHIVSDSNYKGRCILGLPPRPEHSRGTSNRQRIE